MKYLKEFIVGSSFPVVFLFFYYTHQHLVNKDDSKYKYKYSYLQYTMLAPLWFGIWNIISLIIAEKYRLSVRQRFLVVSFLSILSIYLIAHQVYNKTQEEWNKYYLHAFINYMLVWNLIIYNLEKYI
tara:strand:+ start:1087 stop:1467 length:381 start_codon:yes stop_codon:yes gene_type:complete